MDSFPDKHDVYDEKISRQVLTAVGMPPMAISQLKRDNDGALTLAYVNREVHPDSIAFMAVKLSGPVELSSLVKCRGSRVTEVWKYHDQLEADWPDAKTALVFDYHGDKVPDLVIHNCSTYRVADEETGSWHMTVWKGSQGPYYVQEWSEFIKRIKEKHGVH